MPLDNGFDLDEYRRQLQARLGSAPPDQGAPLDQFGSAPAVSLGAPQPAQSPAPSLAGQAPTGDLSAPQGPKKIDALPPDFDPDTAFDKKKLPEVKTAADLVDAMKPKARNQYMDWWEQQHGSIDAVHNKMVAELGERPDPDRKLSRKEKFKMLMDFGINLIKSSQANEQGDNLPGAVAVAAGNTVIDQNNRRTLEGATYDQRRQAIEADRAAQQKTIGNYGDALKGQASIDENQAQMAHYNAEEARAAQEKKNNRPVLYGQDDAGYTLEDSTATQITDKAGKPIKFKPMGSRGGLERDTRPAEQKRYEHLISLGVAPEAARSIAYKQNMSTKDLANTYSSVYRSMLTSTFGDAKQAKEAADDFINTNFGDDALKQIKNSVASPSPPNATPPKKTFDPITGGFR